MQFKVPQFLDIEDKIFGPFTFREFVYLAGGAGLSFVLYRLLGFFWSSIPVLLIIAFSLALVFYRPNNKPFINMIEAGFFFLLKDRLYIWKKDYKKIVKPVTPKENLGKVENSKLTSGKLRDLAWSLDVLDLEKHKNN